MRQRQRQGSGAVVDSSRPAGDLVESNLDSDRQPAPARTPPWDDLFQSASLAQQQELLALAARQGIVYGHQLPAPGSANATNPARTLLAQVVAGQTAHLQPLRITPVEVRDTQLDSVQREAVARAVQTPDLLLLQGFHGTGKSRVVAEVLAQVTARGQRVLLLAPVAAAIDRVLTLLGGHESVCAIRCLGTGEKPEDLPPTSRRLTTAGHVDRLREETLPRARQDLEETTAGQETRLRQEPLWPQLLELTGLRHQLRQQAAALVAAQSEIGPRLDAEIAQAAQAPTDSTGPAFLTRLAAAVRERDDAVARLAAGRAGFQGRETELRAEADAVTARLNAVCPLVEAKEHHRWWTFSYWKATAEIVAEVHQLRTRLEQTEAGLQQLDEERRRLDADEQAIQTRGQHAVDEIVAREKQSRLDETEARQAALRQDEQRLLEKIEAICRELPPGLAVADLTTESVEAAQTAWLAEKAHLDERREFLRGWVACLQSEVENFASRLPGLCNVVAATTSAAAAIVQAYPLPFDLLVLEGAERVTESEFLGLAHLARRWVLVGLPNAPALDGKAKPNDLRRTPPPAARSGLGRTPLLDAWPTFFPRLWQQLHPDPQRLPYAWLEENGRLCCRLRSLSPEQTQWLETERLTDFPDIELRILALPRSEPVLAEVVFPPTMSLVEAKTFVLREVDETAVHPRGRNLWWVEEPNRLVLRMTDEPGEVFEMVPLAEGINEHVRRLSTPGAPLTWQTCCLEFDRAAGWHRERAEEWVQQRLGLRDLGRTARLEVGHRAAPDLTRFLSEVLFHGDLRPHCQAEGDSSLAPAVEFIAVPPLHEPGASPAGVDHRNGDPPTSTLVRTQSQVLPRKGGAGLELDLSDHRHRDRLPSECRAGLPAVGVVNYLEAQAVVRALEALAGETSSVGVLALYPGQAELIRLLVKQSAVLAGSGLDVRIDTPEAFREIECGTLLVSLTRSHNHHAVPFGDDPSALVLALTRAQRRLLVFGDVGTLLRRSQWDQPLEHLDTTASAREREVIHHLVRYLQGQGGHPQTFQVREGSPA